METTINERLSSFMKAVNVTQLEFSRQMRVSKQSVNGWFTGSTSMSAKHLVDMYSLFSNLNYDWLITGRCGMYYKEYDILAEPVVMYKKKQGQICVECVKKDGKIEVLNDQLIERNKRIERMAVLLGDQKQIHGI